MKELYRLRISAEDIDASVRSGLEHVIAHGRDLVTLEEGESDFEAVRSACGVFIGYVGSTLIHTHFGIRGERKNEEQETARYLLQFVGNDALEENVTADLLALPSGPRTALVMLLVSRNANGARSGFLYHHPELSTRTSLSALMHWVRKRRETRSGAGPVVHTGPGPGDPRPN